MKKLDTLEPSFRSVVELVLKEVSDCTGLTWIITSGRRSMAEQTAIYAQGRTTPGPIVTRAGAGDSAHNFGEAADLAPLAADGEAIWWNAPDGYWEAMGAIAQAHGLVWGGIFKTIKDFPHIETATWRERRAAWKRGEIQVA